MGSLLMVCACREGIRINAVKNSDIRPDFVMLSMRAILEHLPGTGGLEQCGIGGPSQVREEPDTG